MAAAQLRPHDYERKLLTENLADDCLFIHAKGLSCDRLLLFHLKLYCDPRTLVFVINCLPEDEKFLTEQLKHLQVDQLPKFVTADVNANDRKTLYMCGGVQFITSRILINDLLKHNVNAEHIAGIVVCRAHKLLHSFQESFILRLYRQGKADGFVKAFSDNSTAIVAGGIGQLQRLVSRLYVRRVILVPRFESNIKAQLEASAAELIQINVPLDTHIAKIESCLCHLITVCLRELRQCAVGLTPEELESTSKPTSDEPRWMIESAAIEETGLERELRRRQMISGDNAAALPDKVVRLSGEMEMLRELLAQCEECDAVSIYDRLNAFRSNQQAFDANSGWLFTQTAEQMFDECRRAVGLPVAKVDAATTEDERESTAIPPSYPAKWTALQQVLDEIRIQHSQYRREQSKNGVNKQDFDAGNILLLTASEGCCRQIYDVLKDGAPFMWARQMLKVHARTSKDKDIPIDQLGVQREPVWPFEKLSLFIHRVAEEFDKQKVVDVVTEAKIEQKQKLIEKKAKTKVHRVDATSERCKQRKLDDFAARVVTEDENSNDKTVPTINQPVVNDTLDDFDPMQGPSTAEPPLYCPWLVIKMLGERYQLVRALQTLSPTYIILYHIDLNTMRMIEVYTGTVGHAVRVYLLMHRQSTEEHRYLTSVRREQHAFEMLIRENATLLVPREYDTTRALPVLSKINSRRAGGADAPEAQRTPTIIVDTREFNSELPLVLHARGIDIVPVTLDVGDYVLTPTTCVERKSYSDLCQSLNNGRVYTQCEQMLRHYARVVLLIEGQTAGQHRHRPTPFTGEQGKRAVSTRAYLCLLIRLCTRVRLLWSGSPLATAELFDDLKVDQLEPDVDSAMAARWDAVDSVQRMNSTLAATGRALNATAQKFMQKVPGMADANVVRLMTSASAPQNLLQLLQITEPTEDVSRDAIDLFQHEFHHRTE